MSANEFKTEIEQNKIVTHTVISYYQIIDKMKVLFFTFCVTLSSSTYIPPYYEGSPTSIRYALVFVKTTFFATLTFDSTLCLQIGWSGSSRLQRRGEL